MTKNRFGDFFHPIFAVDLVYDFMISVNNVSVVFGGFYLLDSVSFLINKKDRIGLTGRNGAGKSTTLKMLAAVSYTHLDVYKRQISSFPTFSRVVSQACNCCFSSGVSLCV